MSEREKERERERERERDRDGDNEIYFPYDSLDGLHVLLPPYWM